MSIVELDEINEAIRLRGLFVQRYSGVEWAVASLILHAQQHPSYAEFKGLPWAWSGKQSKLQRVRRLLAHGGPLDPHRGAIEDYLRAFAELDERRNFMVHAIMVPRQEPGRGDGFRFTMFRPTKEGTDYGWMFATLDELAALADAVEPISTGVAKLAASIIRSMDVPPIVLMFDMDAPPPSNVKLGGRI